ncbi:MAG: DUF3472 domain-containing protein [Burkholderiales bacterium]|nr:DUF3472 domain-containing protein [Burkholderiales bacterium]
MTWHQEPANGWGMYALYQFAFQAGQIGYTGLQKTTDTSRPKTAIFSIWDVGNRQTALPLPGTACVRFGHEGTGTSCIIAFNWKPDTEYKMRVWKLSSGNSASSEKWGAWVIDVKTTEETLVGIIELLNANNHIGYGNLTDQGHVSATEYFAGPANATCANLPYFGVTWKGPLANNGSVNPIQATGTYPTSGGGAECVQSNNTSGAPFSVTQETGSTVRRTTPQRSNLWAGYDLAKFNAADCIFNWAERQYPATLNQTPFKQRRLSQSLFGYYYRDYRINGTGSAVVADVVSNKIITSAPGGQNTVLGDIRTLANAAGCGY